MQATLQNPRPLSFLHAPKPIKPVQHNLLQSKALTTATTSSRSSPSGFSEIAERMSETRRDSQNPVERDDFFQSNEDKELNEMEREIQQLLDL